MFVPFYHVGAVSSVSDKKPIKIPSEPSLGDGDELEDEILYSANEDFKATSFGKLNSATLQPFSAHSPHMEAESLVTVTCGSGVDVKSIGHDFRAQTPGKELEYGEDDEDELSSTEIWRADNIEEDSENFRQGENI